MTAAHGVEIGVDIGGTFTDVVCSRPGHPVHIMKVPTTRNDPSGAVLEALNRLVEEHNVHPEDITRFVHGTTVATNAVIERRGAPTGVLATRGFADVLEIGRQLRTSMYHVILDPETPTFIAPGAHRKEIPERVGPRGEIVEPLDEEAVLEAVDQLKRQGVQSIAIAFLFSFLDPTHERRARELISDRYPELLVSISSEVDPAFREFERTLVTVFDAYVKPTVDRYLANLKNGIADAGIEAPLQIMQSRGGASAAGIARQRPVRLFLSGPAAGVIGGRLVGEGSNSPDIITVDIGGTSADIALITDGQPMIRSEGLICGYSVRVPMVDVNTIGAGGGSIAWIDGTGGLKVGPHSAGSEPGPACYGRKGQDATVTDASVVLGYLDPKYFAGGTLELYPEEARRVVEQRVARPLGMDLEEAALGIHRVVNAQLAEGIRLVSIRRGVDPRRFCLVPLGGAGPVHATALADELGISRIVLPRHPGVLSAIGLLAAPVEHEVSAAFPRALEGLFFDEVRTALDDLSAKCRDLMDQEAVDPEQVSISYFADVCYIGQSHHLEVSVAIDAADPLAKLLEDFKVAHDQIYGHSTDSPARIVNLRAVHQYLVATDIGPEGEESSGDAIKGTRSVLFPAPYGRLETSVWDRVGLTSGTQIQGPAIVEQSDTTTVIAPGWQGEVNARGDLVIEKI